MEGPDRIEIFVDSIFDYVGDPVLVEVLGESAGAIASVDKVNQNPGGRAIAPAAFPVFLMRIFVSVRRISSEHPPKQHRIRRNLWRAP